MALKVYGGATMVGMQQVRTIVAASNQKEAAELLGTTLHEIRSYWSVTGNELEIDTALASPRTVFKSSSLNDVNFAPHPGKGSASGR